MIDPAIFRQVLGHYPTGVCVITSAESGGSPIGMSVGSFTSVSLDPPLVAFFPSLQSSTWPSIRDTGRFCVNVLSDQQATYSQLFAASRTDKFKAVSHRRSPHGLPILDGAVAWIDCHLYAEYEVGDHYIAVGEVCSLEAATLVQPLLFHKGSYAQLSPITTANAENH